MNDTDLVKLALLIASVGGFKDYLASDTGLGFKLREHDADRDKLLSPFYFDLRAQKSPEPGPLTAEIIQLAGEKLAELVQRRGLLRQYAYVAGLPSTGDPFTVAMLDALPSTANITALKIIKQPVGHAGKEYHFKLDEEPPPPDTRVLLIDDLASTNRRKLHVTAMLRKHRLVVTDCVVLVDRRRVSERNKNTDLAYHSLFTIESMVAVYRKFGIFKNHEVSSVILHHVHS